MPVQEEWLSDDTLWLRGLPAGASDSLRGFPGVCDVSEAWGVTAVYLESAAVPSEFDIQSLLDSVTTPNTDQDCRCIEVLVDWSKGEDLDLIAERTGISSTAIIQMVEEAEFTVEAIGFQPGFPYLSGLPTPLCGVPRRVPPRGVVPKGAIAIAEDMAGIYPSASPGGWNIIAVTPIALFENDHCLFRVGDKVIFRGGDR